MKVNRLKAAMLIKDISAQELAEKMGISYVTLIKKMNGDTQFKLDEMRQISELLEIGEPEVIDIFFND